MVNTKLIKYFSLVLLFSGSALLGANNPAAAAAAPARAAAAPAAFDGTSQKAIDAADKLRRAVDTPIWNSLNNAVAEEINADGNITKAKDVSLLSQGALTYAAVDTVTQNEPTTPKGIEAYLTTLDRLQKFKNAGRSEVATQIQLESDKAAQEKKAANAKIKKLEEQANTLKTSCDNALLEKAKAEEARSKSAQVLSTGLADAKRQVAAANDATAAANAQRDAALEQAKKAGEDAALKNADALAFAVNSASQAQKDRIAALVNRDATIGELDTASKKARRRTLLAIDMQAILKKVQKNEKLEDADKKAIDSLTKEPLTPRTPKKDMSVSAASDSSSSSSSSSSASASASSSSSAAPVAGTNGTSTTTSVGSTTSATPAAARSSWLSWLSTGSSRYHSTPASSASIAAPTSSSAPATATTAASATSADVTAPAKK